MAKWSRQTYKRSVAARNKMEKNFRFQNLFQLAKWTLNSFSFSNIFSSFIGFSELQNLSNILYSFFSIKLKNC